MNTETAATTEAPDNSVPATTETPTLLGKTAQETFRNAMKAEAERTSGTEVQTTPQTSTETKPAKGAEASPQKSVADEIPAELFAPSKKEEAPVDDAPPELHGNTSKSIREHFAKQGDYYKGKLKAREEELNGIRKELETLKSKNGAPSEDYRKMLEEVTKQRDELNERLERNYYQDSDAFRQKFTAREERLRNVAEKIFEDVGGDKSILSQALAMSGRRRDDFLDEQDLGATTKARLASVLSQIDLLAEERNAELSSSHEKISAMRAEAEARQKAEEDQQIAQEKTVIEQVRKQVADTLLPFRKVEGNEDWNRSVDERHKIVDELIHGNIDFKTVVEYAFAAAGAKVTDRLNQRLMEENAALRDKLSGMSAVQPQLNGRDKAPASEDEREAKMSPDERARATFNRLVKPTLNY